MGTLYDVGHFLFLFLLVLFALRLLFVTITERGW